MIEQIFNNYKKKTISMSLGQSMHVIKFDKQYIMDIEYTCRLGYFQKNSVKHFQTYILISKLYLFESIFNVNMCWNFKQFKFQLKILFVLKKDLFVFILSAVFFSLFKEQVQTFHAYLSFFSKYIKIKLSYAHSSESFEYNNNMLTALYFM